MKKKANNLRFFSLACVIITIFCFGIYINIISGEPQWIIYDIGMIFAILFVSSIELEN